MQLEIYSLTALKDQISVSLEAICDSYSSLLWDIEFYQCGCFEVYIAASPQNVSIFQRGRIVARSDDAQHFGIIESLQLETDAEKGDYLTVTGRFLACLLERRIIYPTITANGSYEDIVRKVLSRNAISAGIRNLPCFSMGTVSGDCWQKTARMQVSYDNILEWLYSLCETIGGSANVRLDGNALKCDLFSRTDRSLLQDDNPHIVFSDAYNNLLSFSYAADDAVQKNFAYVLGCGEGNARKRTTFCSGAEPTYLDRYEVYVDERNTAQEEDVTDAEYLEILKSSGAEHLVQPKTASESAIAVFSTNFRTVVRESTVFLANRLTLLVMIRSIFPPVSVQQGLLCGRLCDCGTEKIRLDSTSNPADRHGGEFRPERQKSDTDFQRNGVIFICLFPMDFLTHRTSTGCIPQRISRHICPA